MVDHRTGGRDDEEEETEETIRARKAGKAGGNARADALTSEERSEIAKKAAKARGREDS